MYTLLHFSYSFPCTFYFILLKKNKGNLRGNIMIKKGKEIYVAIMIKKKGYISTSCSGQEEQQD